MHLTRPDVSLRGRFAPVAISGRHFQFVQGADKTYQPIASVAALSERLWQLQISACSADRIRHCRGAACRSRRCTCSPYRPPSKWHAPIASVAALSERLVGVIQRQQGTGAPRHSLTCHCEGALRLWQSREGTSSSYKVPIKRTNRLRLQRRSASAFGSCKFPRSNADRVMPPNLSLRGGRRPTWRPERAARGSALGVQSRSARLNHWKAFGENATAFPRLQRAQSALAMTNRGRLPF